MLGQLVSVTRHNVRHYYQHNMKTNCWLWNCIMIFKFYLLRKVAGFQNIVDNGTLDMKPVQNVMLLNRHKVGHNNCTHQ